MLVSDYVRLSKSLNPSESLAASIGDTVLMATNPTFRAIRHAALACGVRYELDPGNRYYVNKFSLLHDLRNTRRLPYLPNLTALEAVASESRRRLSLHDVAALDMRFNSTTLHEAAHIVAANILPTPNSQRRIVEALLLEEAFTDTAELLTHLHTRNEAERFSARMNAYIAPLPRSFKLSLSDIRRTIGGPALAAMSIVVSWLCHHFSASITRGDSRAMAGVLSDLRLVPGSSRYVLSAISILYTTMRRPVTPYREQVARVYMKTRGLEASFARAIKPPTAAPWSKNNHQMLVDSIPQMIRCLWPSLA